MTGISRLKTRDHWGVRSQNRAEEAIKSGFFEREITPVTLPDGTTVSTDARLRPTRRHLYLREGLPPQTGVPGPTAP